jgi:hypothetical protein
MENTIHRLHQNDLAGNFKGLSPHGDWIVDLVKVDKLQVPRFTSTRVPTITVTAPVSMGSYLLAGMHWAPDGSAVSFIAEDYFPGGCLYNKVAIFTFESDARRIGRTLVRLKESACLEVEWLADSRLYIPLYDSQHPLAEDYIEDKSGTMTPTTWAAIDSLRSMIIRRDPNDSQSLVLVDPHNSNNYETLFIGDNPIVIASDPDLRLVLISESPKPWEPPPFPAWIVNVDTKTIEATFEINGFWEPMVELRDAPTKPFTAIVTRDTNLVAYGQKQIHLWFIDWRKKELVDYGDVLNFWGWREMFNGFLIESGNPSTPWLEVIRP